MLASGSFSEGVRACDGNDSDTLSRCAEDEAVASLAVLPSPSELASLNFNLRRDAGCETGGVGYGCKLIAGDDSGA